VPDSLKRGGGEKKWEGAKSHQLKDAETKGAPVVGCTRIRFAREVKGREKNWGLGIPGSREHPRALEGGFWCKGGSWTRDHRVKRSNQGGRRESTEGKSQSAIQRGNFRIDRGTLLKITEGLILCSRPVGGGLEVSVR